MKKQLVILLGADEKEIAAVHKIESAEYLQMDEKILACPGAMFRFIRRNKYRYIYFACIEIILQRFHYLMFLYCFLKLMPGAIIDTHGNKKRFNVFRFLLFETPLFVIECLVSIGLIIIYYVKLYILRKSWTKST